MILTEIMMLLGISNTASILTSCLLFFCIILAYRFAVLPDIHRVEDQLKKLQQNANDYGVGTRLLIRRDLELSRANEKLRDVDELKSNFISIVAHQLRTPLSGIKWMLDMIINGEMGELNNDQKTFLMKSYESNNRMINLVNDMLSTDRIQSGKVHYGFTYLSIIDLLDSVLFEVSPAAVKKNITIQLKSKFMGMPQAYVDPETMRAVIQNLLENAIKYTIVGGKIEVDVQNKRDHLEVSIKDNGIGIPEDEKAKLFSRFFRAANAIKFETDGSGLGLYITKAIVEANRGKIWFESEVGRGSTFYFTVPLGIINKTVNKSATTTT